MNIGNCSVCGKEANLGIDDRCNVCLADLEKVKKFKCPNCNVEMELDGTTKYEKDKYDKWICEDCSHIIVLDWRSE